MEGHTNRRKRIVAQTNQATNRSTDSASRNGAAGALGRAGKAVTGNPAFPIASAMAGAAAALALRERRANRRKRVLGVPIPGTGARSADELARSIGEAGKQLARLADEVRTGRKKAEQIGKALS
jgi:hypothetical protein